MASSALDLLLSALTDADVWVGLLASQTTEVQATGYRRLKVGAWDWSGEQSARTIAGAEVCFTGFQARAIGFFLAIGERSPILLPFPFEQPRTLVEVVDQLYVVPTLTLRWED